MLQIQERKKVNFMINQQILIKLEDAVPSGKRSDFVNQALEEALIHYSRKKAIEGMDILGKKIKLKITDKEIKKLRNYGRK